MTHIWKVGPTMNYFNYTYEYDIDLDPDDGVRKISHEIRKPNGELYSPRGENWSPYKYPTLEQFEEEVIDNMLREYFQNDTF